MTRTTAETTARLGIIDDDSGFAQVLRNRLDASGAEYRFMQGPIPVDALRPLRLNAVVLDLEVAGTEAWSYLEDICARLPGLGVIVCTGRSTVAQRVRGLRLGADDWITKPCHPEEVIARVEAVIRRRRRTDSRAAAPSLTAGELEIRPDRFQVFAGDASLQLTRREFELLHLLARADGQVLPREEIYAAVWGYQMVHGDRSVDVFVRKLRLKLNRASPEWRYIHTHFGVGYRFGAERVAGDTPTAARSGSVAATPAVPAAVTVSEARLTSVY